MRHVSPHHYRANASLREHHSQPWVKITIKHLPSGQSSPGCPSITGHRHRSTLSNQMLSPSVTLELVSWGPLIQIVRFSCHPWVHPELTVLLLLLCYSLPHPTPRGTLPPVSLPEYSILWAPDLPPDKPLPTDQLQSLSVTCSQGTLQYTNCHRQSSADIISAEIITSWHPERKMMGKGEEEVRTRKPKKRKVTFGKR
jgi:hypothetical protein